MKYEMWNLGDGVKKHAVYEMPTRDASNYWRSVTDVPCPVCKRGMVRWNEAGYVPGSRCCDACGRFFQAVGSIATGVKLIRDARFDRRKS